MAMKINVFWFRRDLRLEDNHGLFEALKDGHSVLPIFIFDKNILEELPKNDARVGFIYDTLIKLNEKLQQYGSSILVKHGSPMVVWQELIERYEINAVFTNHDYEPYGISRDQEVTELLQQKGIGFHTFKDQVIFEKAEITKADGSPYTVYTPYKNKWRENFSLELRARAYPSEQLLANTLQQEFDAPTLKALGFTTSGIQIPSFKEEFINGYEEVRDIPHLDKTTKAGLMLRFGNISVRELVRKASSTNQTYLNELIWREFFMMILFHFPKVVGSSFKAKYDNINWLNNKEHFERWCEGTTGYPMVDAGMRQLNKTGFMHNRVRMVVASFLCKHLLIDWRWGEAYFAEKLLDFELSSNNGNWQWAAGCGCDAAPYFRVFNPTIQVKKFDPEMKYIKNWIPELNSLSYPEPIVKHSMARDRAIDTYKRALSS
ncbi:MAG: deoxyribodipyrimidine photo-lyase [Cyclobacteriaceae bacterium]